MLYQYLKGVCRDHPELHEVGNLGVRYLLPGLLAEVLVELLHVVLRLFLCDCLFHCFAAS